MSSACRLLNDCLVLLTNLSIETNNVYPDQTAAIGAVWSGSMLFVKEASKKNSADDKTEDICFCYSLVLFVPTSMLSVLKKKFKKI